MSEEEETRHQLIRRLFYLITVAAEDAAAMAADGQSVEINHCKAWAMAIGLRELGERIEILSTVIEELSQDST